MIRTFALSAGLCQLTLCLAAAAQNPFPRSEPRYPLVDSTAAIDSLSCMRMLGNVLWFLFAGLWLALGYATSGILLCLTIVGIPFGIQAFKLAGFTLWPFGRIVTKPAGSGCLSFVFNLLWLVLFGWELFLGHLASGLLLCATIVGIPFGIQAFKLSVLSLWPFGRVIVDEASMSHSTREN